MSAVDQKPAPTPAPTLASAPATAAPPAPAAPRLQGRLDALEGNRLFGWAFDPDAPSERLVVKVRLAGREIASVSADRPRVDLRRNGVGDGGHAFDVDLPAEAMDRLDALEVVALSGAKPPLVLPMPRPAERAAEAAIAAPVNRLFEKMDVVAGAQRQLQLAQRDAAQALARLTARMDEIAAEGGSLETAVRGVEVMQREIAERVGDIEVFLVRFDSTLGSFDQRILALQASGNHHARPLLLVAAALAGVVAGAALALAAL
ncbi:hypothetical protein [Chthonobacter rhizosphaerae]|uniref:hypothetical protein n=1 Tax=Chthonobacter rhizosphaerae TaxID=2735553 RepID=UPI0015EFA8CE|nr:hypothetical protein [Chthonobacter rhizosphaerae]